MLLVQRKTVILGMLLANMLWLVSLPALASQNGHERFVVSEPNQILTATTFQNFVFDGGSWYYARKISFTVRNDACGSAKFEVSVNGDRKMGYDISHCDQKEKTYTVTVGESTNSLGVRVTSGSLVVKEIVVEGHRKDHWDECLFTNPCPPVDRPRYRTPREDSIMNPSRSPITKYARQIIQIVDDLRPLTMYADYGDYLLPVKLHAGKVEPLSRSRGSLSPDLKEAVEVLIRQIDAAEEYFADAATADRQYELILDLREVRHLLYREFI